PSRRGPRISVRIPARLNLCEPYQIGGNAFLLKDALGHFAESRRPLQAGFHRRPAATLREVVDELTDGQCRTEFEIESRCYFILIGGAGLFEFGIRKRSQLVERRRLVTLFVESTVLLFQRGNLIAIHLLNQLTVVNPQLVVAA